MPKVISSIAQATGRGVFIIFKAVPEAVKATGTGRTAMVAQLPWGPADAETAFGDAATFRDTFAPEGFDRTGAAYLMATRFPWVDLRIVRVVGTDAVKAAVTLQNSTPANCLTVTGKYFGAAGNGITVDIANPTDADVNHFKLTVTKTDSATGRNTQEVFDNVDATKGTSDPYWTTLTADSKLLGPLTKVAAGRPVNGNFTLASGTDGTINAAAYLGTPGNGDKGVSVLEKDRKVRFVITDDPPSGARAAVMAGVKAHADLMTDRIGVLFGPAAQTKTQAITDRGSNRSENVAYVYPWCVVRDDEGTARTIPLSGAFAALCTVMAPHLSPAYKNPDFTQYMGQILSLDVSTGVEQTKIDLEAEGIIAFEENDDGTFSPYADVTTATSLLEVFVTRMRQYIGFSLAGALEPYKNAPNDSETIEDQRTIVDGFLAQLVTNKTIDHISLPCIDGKELLPVIATNTQASLDAGDVTLGFKAKLIAAQRRIFLQGQISKTVTISATTE